MCKKLLLAVFLATALGVGSANALPYVAPGDITASQSDDIWGYIAALTADHNDLDFTNPADPISTWDSLNYWLSYYDYEPFSVTHTSPASGNEVYHWVRYDFSSAKMLDRMLIWNGAYPGYSNRSVKDAEVYYTTDSGATWNLLVATTLTEADGTAPRTASDVISLGGMTVDGIVIDVLSSYYWDLDPFNYASMQQVLFDEVPEPTTMVLLGLGSLALIRRKRAA